jgi:hypothetical protein
MPAAFCTAQPMANVINSGATALAVFDTMVPMIAPFIPLSPSERSIAAPTNAPNMLMMSSYLAGKHCEAGLVPPQSDSLMFWLRLLFIAFIR